MSAQQPEATIVGVLGGMGPIASAAFVQTIYEIDPPPCEQAAPRVVLWSDPAIVDRTTAIHDGELGALLDAVDRAAGGLLDCGVDRIVMACVTAHTILGQLPTAKRDRIASLIDAVFDELERRDEPYLLVTTTGTRTARIFDGHERWPAAERNLRYPSEQQQHEFHQLLYALKRNEGVEDMIDYLRDTVTHSGTCGFVAGCTELHLVARTLTFAHPSDDLSVIDPLMIMAERIRAGAV